MTPEDYRLMLADEQTQFIIDNRHNMTPAERSKMVNKLSGDMQIKYVLEYEKPLDANAADMFIRMMTSVHYPNRTIEPIPKGTFVLREDDSVVA